MGEITHHVGATAGGRFAAESVAPVASAKPAPTLRSVAPSHGGLSSRPYVSVRLLRSPVLAAFELFSIVCLSLTCGVGYSEYAFGNAGDLSEHVGKGLIVGIFYCSTLRLMQSANSAVAATWWQRLRGAETSWIAAFALLVFSLFVLKSGETVSRGATLSLFLAGLVAMPTIRILFPRLIERATSERGFARRAAIVLASGGDYDLSDALRELQLAGYDTVVLTFDAGIGAERWPAERLTILERALKVAHKVSAGEVFVLAGTMAPDRLLSIQSGLSKLPRAVHVIPDKKTAALLRNPVTSFGETVSIEVQKEPLSAAERVAKRLVDIVASASLLVFLAPIFAAIAVVIKIDSRGPVFFRQNRNGLSGEKFRIVKFRTMRVLEDGGNIAQATKDDARVTRFGAWLRRTSLDELPQLVNVLFGQMSLVGPRPHAVAHDEYYSKLIEHYDVRQHVKPGITGWAQVNGLRGETRTMDQMYRRIELDLWYARNATLLLDAQILLRTVGEVFRQTNAY